MSDYKCDVDLLDVCSMDIAVSIIQYHWEQWFSKFFNNDSWNTWEDKLRLCARARNPMAHGHEEYLTAEQKSYVNEYCDEIIKLLSNTNACVDIITECKKEENILRRDIRKKYYSMVYDNVDETIVGKVCEVTAAEQTSKSIRGFCTIDGKTYSCSIGKAKWSRKFPNNSLRDHLGKKFNIRITSVNISQNTIQVELE